MSPIPDLLRTVALIAAIAMFSWSAIVASRISVGLQTSIADLVRAKNVSPENKQISTAMERAYAARRKSLLLEDLMWLMSLSLSALFLAVKGAHIAIRIGTIAVVLVIFSMAYLFPSIS